MSLMIEDRGQNKRRRTDDEGSTESSAEETTWGGFTASPTDPANLKSIITKLGPRLEGSAAVLATLPTELQDLLIPDLSEMLSIIATIKQW